MRFLSPCFPPSLSPPSTLLRVPLLGVFLVLFFRRLEVWVLLDNNETFQHAVCVCVCVCVLCVYACYHSIACVFQMFFNKRHPRAHTHTRHTQHTHTHLLGESNPLLSVQLGTLPYTHSTYVHAHSTCVHTITWRQHAYITNKHTPHSRTQNTARTRTCSI